VGSTRLTLAVAIGSSALIAPCHAAASPNTQVGWVGGQAALSGVGEEVPLHLGAHSGRIYRERRVFGVVFMYGFGVPMQSEPDVRQVACSVRSLVVRAKHPRIAREKETVEEMVRIRCRGHHGTQGHLCRDSKDLLQYARERLEKCPFQDGKPTCASCAVHCYRPSMREEISAVMRYAGPRMPYRRPILAVRHLTDGLRKHPTESADDKEIREET
jgi:hypothetical protein